jgi:hypothetical protein
MKSVLQLKRVATNLKTPLELFPQGFPELTLHVKLALKPLTK